MTTPRWALRGLFAAAGAFTLAAQTVLLREHLVVYGGNELGVGVFFASWFVWVAVGALPALAWPRARAALARGLAWLPLAYPIALVGEILLVRAIRGFTGVEAFAAPPVGPLLAWTALVNAPVSLITGALFPAGAARAAAGRSGPEAVAPVTALYALEALGAFVGGAAVTGALSARASATDLALAAALGMAAAAVAFAWRARERAPLVAAGLATAALAAALVTPAGVRLRAAADAVRESGTLPGVPFVAAADTPYQHAAVARRGDQTIVLLNGRVAAAFPAGERPLQIVALALGERPRPASVLVLGAGAPALVPPLLDLTEARLTLVWPDEDVAALVLPHLPAGLRGALSDPRVTTLHEDPRRLLGAGAPTPAGVPWDLVVLDLPDPDTAVANRLYTADFFAALHDRMAPDGVLLTRLRAAENVLDAAHRRLGGSVLATLRQAFPDVVLVPGEETWFLAGREGAGLVQTPEALAGRYHAGALRPEQFSADLYATLVEPRRVEEARAAYEAAVAEEGRALVNTDARPVTYFLDLLVWAAESGPALVAALDALRSAGGWLLLAPLLVLLAVRIHRAALRGGDRAQRDRWNGAALLAAFGGGSIALQLTLLLAFQSRFGDLYWLVGLLNAVFMAGLAAGGALGVRFLPRLFPGRPTVAALVVACAGLAGAASLPVLLGGLSTGAAAAAGEWAWGLLVLAVGFVAGAGFPAAGGLAARGREAGEGGAAGGLAGALEWADHWGAALGAAVSGLVLIPLLGGTATCLVVAAALAVPAVLLAGELAADRLGLGERPSIARFRAARRTPSLPWDRLAHGLFVLGAGVAVVAAVTGARLDRPRLRFDAAELRTVVRADRFEAREAPYPHTVAFDDPTAEPGGAPIPVAVAGIAASRAVAPDVEGWGGPLNLLVAVDGDGRLARVRLVESRETPAYVAGLGAWLERLHGRSAAAPLRIGVDVDALTGATVTSSAVLTAVRATAATLAEDVFALPAAPPPAAPGFWARLGPAGWYLIVALLLAVPITLRVRRGWLRRVVLAANLVLGGFVFNVVFSTEQAANLLLGRLPGAGDPAGLVLVLGVLALGLLVGPAYCAAVCPFGAAQELVGDAAGARPPGAGFHARIRGAKYVLLVGLVLVAALGARGWLVMDPLQQAFSFPLGWTVWTGALVALVLAASALYPRFWCRTLCPVGALLNLTNGLALLRRWRPPRVPARCDLGTVRPTADLDCMQCNRCVPGRLPAVAPRDRA